MTKQRHMKWFLYAGIAVVAIVIVAIAATSRAKATEKHYEKPEAIDSIGIVKMDGDGDEKFDNEETDVYLTSEDLYYLYELTE